MDLPIVLEQIDEAAIREEWEGHAGDSLRVFAGSPSSARFALASARNRLTCSFRRRSVISMITPTHPLSVACLVSEGIGRDQ